MLTYKGDLFDRFIAPTFYDEFYKSFSQEYLLYRDEETKELYLEIDLPGVKKEDVKVSVDDKKVYIIAERKGNRPSKFEKTIALTKGVDTTTTSVRLDEGVLRITFGSKDKIETSKRDIEIK